MLDRTLYNTVYNTVVENRSAPVWFLVLLLAIAGLSCSTLQQRRDLHLIVISMDGLSPDYYLEAEARAIQLPTLRQLMAHGSYSDGARSVYPSLTYPAHASMVSGVLPKVHGIFGNNYPIDAELQPVVSGRVFRVDPIWRYLRRYNLTVGAVFWPTTKDEPIDWLLPEVWWDEDKGNDEVRLRKQAAVSTPGLLDSLRGFIGAPLEKYFESDTVKTDAAIYILKKYRPNLLLLHYSHFDYLQHVHGRMSPEANAAAEMQDTQIGRLVEVTRELGIFDRTIFMIVSDHGHANYDTLINPGVLLVREGLIDTVAATNSPVWLLPSGGSCSILPRRGDSVAVRRQLEQVISDLVARTGRAIEYVWWPPQIDSLGADPRAVVMLEAADGYAFGSALTGEVLTPAQFKATHGYLPDKPEMLAGFILAGGGLPAHGNIGHISVVDIFATIADLFQVRVPVNDGRSLLPRLR